MPVFLLSDDITVFPKQADACDSCLHDIDHGMNSFLVCFTLNCTVIMFPRTEFFVAVFNTGCDELRS